MQLARCRDQWFPTPVRNLQEGFKTPLLPTHDLQLIDDVAPGLHVAALFLAISHFAFILPENLPYNSDISVKLAQNSNFIFLF